MTKNYNTHIYIYIYGFVYLPVFLYLCHYLCTFCILTRDIIYESVSHPHIQFVKLESNLKKTVAGVKWLTQGKGLRN